MKTMRLVWNILMLVVVACILAIGAMLYGAPMIGMEAFVISGDSMAPAYKANSIAYTKKQDSYEVGDVVLFNFQSEGGSQVAIGRINKINEDGSCITKGDANDNVDEGVRNTGDIVGIVKIDIPYIGAIPGALSSLNCIYIVLGAALLLISATIIINVIYKESFSGDREIAQMIEEDIETEELKNRKNEEQIETEELTETENPENRKTEKLTEDEKTVETYVPIGAPDAIVGTGAELSTDEVYAKDEVYKPIGNDDDASVYEVIYRKNSVH